MCVCVCVCSVDLKIAVNSDLRRYKLSMVHINQSLERFYLVSDLTGGDTKNTDNCEFFRDKTRKISVFRSILGV